MEKWLIDEKDLSKMSCPKCGAEYTSPIDARLVAGFGMLRCWNCGAECRDWKKKGDSST